jgi:hypothetical protein
VAGNIWAIHAGSIFVTPVTYAGNVDKYIIKAGASNNSGWDGFGLKLKSNSGGSPYMSLHTSYATETMVLRGPKVGIGINNPTASLHVAGNIWASGSNGNIISSANISASGLLFASASLGFENIATYNSQSGQFFYTSSQGLSNQLDTFKATGQRTGNATITGNTIIIGSLKQGSGGNNAAGVESHAEGAGTQAQGEYSHAEGESTTAQGNYSHAEGLGTTAQGESSHAEGAGTTAQGESSHAEGDSTTAQGDYSHAEGAGTTAQGNHSHAEGLETVTSGLYQHAQGQYNLSSSAQSAFIIGNGTSNNLRSNLVFASGSQFQITGSLTVSGSITASGTISASGLLFASASLGFENIATYNSQSGQFFYTSSQGLSNQLNTFKVTGQRSGNSVITGSLFLTGSSGHLTASGNISANGTGSFGMLRLQGGQRISFDDDSTSDQFISGDDHNITIDGDNFIKLKADSRIDILNTSGNDTISFDPNVGHMTASGNISASGILQGVNFHAFNNITRVGMYAGSNNIGLYQTAVGYGAGHSNTVPYQTAIGNEAGYGNEANLQTAIGNKAGYENSGFFQTAIGSEAGYTNSGLSQTAVGYFAGYGNTASYQTAVGVEAGVSNQGDFQTAIGYAAGANNQGHNLVAIGPYAGVLNKLDNQFIVKNLNANATPLIQGNFQSGSIGIGLALPQANLHVSGNIWASGSKGHITASANISASGLLFISASQNTGQTYGVLVRDPATGRVYHTGSYSEGGGDNLGNHTATQALDMNSNSIKNVTNITASNNISASGYLQGVNFHAFDGITRVGVTAGYNNIGASQTAVGYAAGDSNQGDYQIAIGIQAGLGNYGDFQTAVGVGAGQYNYGNNLIAIGNGAGSFNTLDNQFIVKHSNASATPLIQGNFESGSIGIGLALPQANLHVVGNILATTNITASGNISASGTGSFGMVGIGTTAPVVKLDIKGSAENLRIISTTAGNTHIGYGPGTSAAGNYFSFEETGATYFRSYNGTTHTTRMFIQDQATSVLEILLPQKNSQYKAT